MPIIPSEEKRAQCPYCYEGVIEYDKYSDTFYCERCMLTVKIKGYKK